MDGFVRRFTGKVGKVDPRTVEFTAVGLIEDMLAERSAIRGAERLILKSRHGSQIDSKVWFVDILDDIAPPTWRGHRYGMRDMCNILRRCLQTHMYQCVQAVARIQKQSDQIGCDQAANDDQNCLHEQRPWTHASQTFSTGTENT